MASTPKKRKSEGSGKHCVVVGCSNNSKKLTKWKKEVCEIHSQTIHTECSCVQPYQMHRFPGGSCAESEMKRNQWVKNINRKDFIPANHSTVCSIHFEEGRPTANHPYPTLAMGYKSYKHLSPGRAAPRRRVSITPLVTDEADQANDNNGDFQEEAEATASVEASHRPETRDASVQWYDFTIADHNYCLPRDIVRTQSKATQTDPIPEISGQELKDESAKFYTGLSKDMFWNFVNAMIMSLTAVPTFRMAIHNQMLLVLMRLRLGLMFTDLGVRFKVSRSTACDIFNFWILHMAKFMRENMIRWIPRDTISRIRPKSFASCYPKATCIIDCTEVFVQRPKNLKKRAQTYSNYKSHNTYKALYCIAPNGAVTYVSKLFGGRASDVFISQNSGFCNHLLPGDEVLADRGFTIENILPMGVKLAIPAFTKGKKDRILPEEDVTSTRRIANVRIHVERAIRRLKCFKILANIIPGRVQNVDDILTVCAGLCNMQPLLIDENEDVDTDDDTCTDLSDTEEGDADGVEQDARYMYDQAEVDF